MKNMHLKSVLLISLLCVLVLSGCGKEKTSYTQTAMDALENLDYETASENFVLALDNGEDERLILRGQGMLYMASLQYEAAIESFTAALRLSDGVPNNLDYDINYYLASAYYRNGQIDEAISVYDAILSLKNNEADAYYLRGTVTLEKGDFDAAYADFKSAMNIRGNDYDLVLDIYQIMATQGYKEAGRDMLSSCIASNSNMSDYDMGRFEYYLTNYEEAKNYLERAEEGDDSLITLYLGRTYEALGDYNYAISLYNTYLDKDHDKAQIYNQMGLCQMKMERYSEALASFQAGMNVEDNSILQTLKLNEIIAYEYMNEFQTAANLMREYTKTYPNDSAAVREYEFLKTR